MDAYFRLHIPTLCVGGLDERTTAEERNFRQLRPYHLGFINNRIYRGFSFRIYL